MCPCCNETTSRPAASRCCSPPPKSAFVLWPSQRELHPDHKVTENIAPVRKPSSSSKRLQNQRPAPLSPCSWSICWLPEDLLDFYCGGAQQAAEDIKLNVSPDDSNKKKRKILLFSFSASPCSCLCCQTLGDLSELEMRESESCPLWAPCQASQGLMKRGKSESTSKEEILLH